MEKNLDRICYHPFNSGDHVLQTNRCGITSAVYSRNREALLSIDLVDAPLVEIMGRSIQYWID